MSYLMLFLFLSIVFTSTKYFAESSTIEVFQRGDVVAPETPLLPAAVPHYVPEVKQQNEFNIYEGCGTTKTCFGVPNNCLFHQICDAVVTGAVVDGRYQFELQSFRSIGIYVSFALSTDAEMGNDASMDCIRDGLGIRAYSSWLTPRPSLGLTREGVPQHIITMLNASLINGAIYCKLEREPITTIRGKEFDLVNNAFHWLVAIGIFRTPDSLMQHDLGHIASTQPMKIIGWTEDEDPEDEDIGDEDSSQGRCVASFGAFMLVLCVVGARAYYL